MIELPESEKHTHAEVGYVDDAQIATREDCDDQCSNCIKFIETDRGARCARVQSPINAGGYCNRYVELSGGLESAV